MVVDVVVVVVVDVVVVIDSVVGVSAILGVVIVVVDFVLYSMLLRSVGGCLKIFFL